MLLLLSFGSTALWLVGIGSEGHAPDWAWAIKFAFLIPSDTSQIQPRPNENETVEWYLGISQFCSKFQFQFQKFVWSLERKVDLRLDFYIWRLYNTTYVAIHGDEVGFCLVSYNILIWCAYTWVGVRGRGLFDQITTRHWQNSRNRSIVAEKLKHWMPRLFEDCYSPSFGTDFACYRGIEAFFRKSKHSFKNRGIIWKNRSNSASTFLMFLLR